MIVDENIKPYEALTTEKISKMNESRTNDERTTNISETNLSVLKEMSQANEMDIIMRPVNSTAFNLMQQGAVGKNMFVHGKSVDRGPANGLITTNASISKAGIGDNLDKIKLFQAQNDHSLEYANHEFERIEKQLKDASLRLINSGKTDITQEDLLKEAKVGMEEFDPLISATNLVDINKNQIYIFTKDGIAERPEGDKNNHLYAIKLENDLFQRIDDNHNPVGDPFKLPQDRTAEPVQLIGKPEISIEKDGTIKITDIKPITADIDVLSYGTKLDLYQGDIETHKTILEVEKAKIIEDSKIVLTDQDKEQLTRGNVQQYLDNKGTDLETFKQQNPESGKLLEELRKAEVNRENLRGMGEGVRAVLDITGAMRADFTKVEISHGAEQFNYGFTQPLDKEWVHVNPAGEVKVIKGESELLQVFNKVKHEGRDMPPNPNWGWKLDENGEFKIDAKLKSQNAKVDDLMMKKTSHGTEKDNVIQEILDKRLELGIACTRKDLKLSTQEQSDKINKLTNELDNKLETFERKYNPKIEKSVELTVNSKEQKQESLEIKEPIKVDTTLQKPSLFKKIINKLSFSSLFNTSSKIPEPIKVDTTLQKSSLFKKIINKAEQGELTPKLSKKSIIEAVKIRRKLEKNLPKSSYTTTNTKLPLSKGWER